ncbi:uncharacterized protein EV154DRAFT_514890 [Mucor mucedo]|uniref:uncharacterized protein n=1 Tax=Mucor mucedo TaxID=29922 RepID=UPI002220376C|nr:uncharacterized protein EV154DRAFT_514890 [Mucor mucedo]KAI7889366.1 hypothetical protein EV154DRAFT_514890 [Mucor mucedo]
MQQFDHFEYEYHAMLLRELPPLVPQHPSTPSRVGVIPSSIKRTPLIPPTTHETTTLTHILEPIADNSPKTAPNLSVFSGPHYLPEKYSIKPLTTFRQAYFTPQYKTDSPSRYYVSPHVNQYFQAALQDGSYFESYSDYKPQDPVNFRHAYNLQQPRNSLDVAHVDRELPKRPIRSSNPPEQLPRRMPPVRKWHQPINVSSPSSSEDDSEPSVIYASSSSNNNNNNNNNNSKHNHNHNSHNNNVTTHSKKGKEKEIVPSPSPSQSQTAVTTINKPSGNVSTSEESSDDESESSSSESEIMPVIAPAKKSVLPQKRKQPNPSSPISEAATKKKRFDSIVPSTQEAIEELRQVGKFIKGWTHKDAEVCCVCFEDVTTPLNPLVYCDNALCEVIVHKNCYRIRNNIANADHWYCDRCRPVDGVSVYRSVVCVVCPNLTGAFCKLEKPFHGIGWVHMICAKMLTGPGGFTYQAKTHEYRMTFRHHIPIQRFMGSCVFCDDPMFAEFGAKLKCQYCPKSFHVTCAEKFGYWCFDENATLACADHAILTTTKSSPKRLAIAFEKWVTKRNLFFMDKFEISPHMQKVSVWQRLIQKVRSVSSPTPAIDDMDRSYHKFFDRVQSIRISDTKKHYIEYVKYLLLEFCKSYSSSTLMNVNGLFLKKNFYHSAQYGYVPPKNGFTICSDGGVSGGPKQKKAATATLPAAASMSKFVLRKPDIPAPPLPLSLPSPQPAASTSAPQPQPKPKKAQEQTVVIPSPDLICFICGQHEFPKEKWDAFDFDPGYVDHLEATAYQRKVGHTGSGNSWDPRVFIQCAECNLKVHCGCPTPPIKKYPQKFQSFVCIQCDTKGEDLSLKNDFHRRRGTTGINYKV